MILRQANTWLPSKIRPDVFPPSFFDHLEDRLNLAVFDTNEELRMQRSFDTRKISRDDLTAELDRCDREAGTTERHTRWEGETLIVDWPSAVQSNLTKIDSVVGNSATQHTSKPMSITGLQSGAFQAKLAEMKQRMVEKQNSALARVDTATAAGHAKIDQAIAGVEAKIEKEIEDSLQEFAQFTNGGPA